jgi:adenylate cyclase class 2
MYIIGMSNREIEVRFLEINEGALIKTLIELGASDHGEDFLEEVIFYDKALRWRDEEGKFVRLRQNNRGTFLSYKHHQENTADGTEEIELKVDDFQKAEALLERMGLVAYRHQQKKRHSFELDGVIADIDTWPKIPTYVELEGPSEDALKQVAAKLGFDWKDVVFENARIVIENRYHIPVGNMTWFTFERFE